MGINELRVAVTLFSLLLFIAIWIWAWSRKNQANFDEAARLPLDDAQETAHE
ncbi:MAG: cbb3-type cytochrome c oxidase subunit 3 [Paucibacter sp.]|nr:cbb3-type cytochrome c oxidase subunit 3 [Roseateles sp.]